MARKKRKTERAVARDTVTLSSVFTGIANAIREKTGGSSQITPINMGNAIRGIKGVSEASLPESNLPSVFTDIANAIRACGITGTMTASQMAGKIGDIVAVDNKLRLVVQTTSNYKKSGIYSATRDDTSKPIVIDWGDGTVEQDDGDISKKVHTYSTVGTFNVVVENIKSYEASMSNSTWYSTTSQNRYTLKEVVAIPNSVVSIGYHAFYGCSGLTSVTIPHSVTSIGRGAFYQCKSLTRVEIPDSVSLIRTSTFNGCIGLTSVTMGQNIQGIGSLAFNDCTNCSIFDFRRATLVPTLSQTTAFQGTPTNKEIIVPDELYDDWIVSDNWSSTDNNIVNCIVKASQSSLGPLTT